MPARNRQKYTPITERTLHSLTSTPLQCHGGVPIGTRKLQETTSSGHTAMRPLPCGLTSEVLRKVRSLEKANSIGSGADFSMVLKPSSEQKVRPSLVARKRRSSSTLISRGFILSKSIMEWGTTIAG